MELQTQQLAWGIGFAAMMYIIGNGVWTNNLARRKQWLGWLMWVITSLLVIAAGAFIDIRLSGSDITVWKHITGVAKENHWIELTLFALMSVPGAASVILKQTRRWTRMALILPALIVFIPVGMKLGEGASGVADGIGLAFVIASLMFAWQFLLDTPPEEKQRKAA